MKTIACINVPPLRRSLLAQAISLMLLAGLPGFAIASETTVTSANGVGLSTGSHDGDNVKLNAAGSTGVQAGMGTTVHFDHGAVTSGATTATAAAGQTGIKAKDGGAVQGNGSSVQLVPTTSTNAAITANNLTGVSADSGGTVELRNSTVSVGGGAKGNNNQGLFAKGLDSLINFIGGAVDTLSWGAFGVHAEQGADVRLSDGATVTTTGANSTSSGSHALKAEGDGSHISGSDIAITTSGAYANGARSENGASITLERSSISTSGGYGHGVVADGGNSRATLTDTDIRTSGKGATGVWAKDGGQVSLSGGSIGTSGAAVSAASPLLGEKTLSLSHGLLASGANSRIDADTLVINSGGASASAARAEDGAHIDLKNSTLNSTAAATSTATTAVAHALNGGSIEVDNSALDSSVNNIGGARAEGAGSSVSLRDSSVRVGASGSVVNPAAAARAMAGGALLIDNSTLNTDGQYAHGVTVEGAGSSADIRHTTIDAAGSRTIGMLINGGGRASVSDSAINLGAGAAGIGPYGYGVQVTGSGSTLTLSNSDVHTTQASSPGVVAQEGADIVIRNGSVTTDGNYGSGVSANNSTVSIDNLRVETHGNDNAMGIVANDNATVIVRGGSVTTTGNGSPVANNLTFPHALASRNPGALLIADGTALHTTGSQAYGAAVDDGGSMILKNLSVLTEGEYSRGLYAGIGAAKPGNVSLTANNIAVETRGDNAAGALVSRKYKTETATLDLSDASISTHGVQSHGLQSESGAALTANNTVVETSGLGALGAIANNTASVDLDIVDISTTGDMAHGVVAKNGGTVTGSDVLAVASGNQAAALYAQGTDALKGSISLNRALLHNRDGATVAIAGVADVELKNALIGGSGQWLNVDRSVASDGTSIPDMGTGQWQGVGQSYDSAGKAHIDLSGSIATGSARTAAGSTADLTLRDTSIWRLTGSSNLTNLANDASLIDFSAPVGGSFKTLTTENYTGNNGTLALNTYLFDDGSPSDLLVIDGGTASGSSSLAIRNAGGAGALTTGNGIKVVDAISGGTTTPGSFGLLNRVVAGPYEYTLHRSSLDDSDPDSWYLRSTLADAPTPDTPNYRPETSLYRGIPTQTLLYSRAMVDTLHERVGEERRRGSVDPLLDEDEDDVGPSLGWGRLIYRTGKDTRGSANYDYDLRALQVGLDLYRSEDTDGSTNQAGLSLGMGKVDGAVKHSNGAYAGDDALRGYSLGGYWTHFGPSGWYLDGVLQLHHFEATANPDRLDKVKTRGRGITASLEAGKPFVLNEEKEIYIEPQVQVIHTRITLKDTHDQAASVRFDDVDSLTGRIGVRIDRDWFRTDDKGEIHRTNGWVRPSVWHEFKGKPKTEFSSADGYIPFGVDMSGTWGEVNLGIDHEFSPRTTLTGSVGYQKAFDGDSRSYEGMLGIKFKF